MDGKEIDGKVCQILLWLTGSHLPVKKIYCGRAQKKAERESELKAKYDKLKQERIQRYQGMYQNLS